MGREKRCARRYAEPLSDLQSLGDLDERHKDWEDTMNEDTMRDAFCEEMVVYALQEFPRVWPELQQHMEDKTLERAAVQAFGAGAGRIARFIWESYDVRRKTSEVSR